MSLTFQQSITMTSSNIRPVISTYCFEENPTFQEQIPRVPSDYLLNTGLNQAEIEQERQIIENRLRRTPSSYFRDDLNKANEPEIIARRRVSGLPVRGAQLRGLAASLGNHIYTPTLIDGHLYYVDNEEAALKTARSVNSSDQPEEGVNTCRTIGSRIFTKPLGFSVPMDILERLLPQEMIKSLARGLMTEVLNGRFTLGEQEAFALACLVEGTGPSQYTTTAAPFFSELSLITAENPSATWLQTAAYDSDAALHTARTLCDIHTAHSAARSSSVHTARRRSGSRTDGRGKIRSAPRTPNQRSVMTARSASRTLINTTRSNSNASNLHIARCASRTRDVNLRAHPSAARSSSVHTAHSNRGNSARAGRSGSSNSLCTAELGPFNTARSRSDVRTRERGEIGSAPRMPSQPSVRTARSVSRTPVNTARSNSNLRTARSAYRTPINTARSNSDFRKLSFAPATSPSMRTARTSSNASLSASRPSRPISQSPSQNARGRLSSDSSVKTARLASRSPSINTACSPASTPANTARTRSNSSVHTGRPSSIPDASTAPANDQIVAPTNVILLPVQGEDSVHEIVNPSQLVRTPSSDKRAAAAVCSDVRTARSSNE
ncbi:unnamed protein product, partial [Mesorhabditis belari]|uniref:Uncharacterized protein n=1 Tax=Mesorhabditis belari TaxID=2138241 RepID=A0AAF3FBR5_9BILA